MKFPFVAALLGLIALLNLPGTAPADDVNDYRWHNTQGLYPWSPSWDPYRSQCRVVDVRTTNRWGTVVTIRQRVCTP
jgi:hypothetical protein